MFLNIGLIESQFQHWACEFLGEEIIRLNSSKSVIHQYTQDENYLNRSDFQQAVEIMLEYGQVNNPELAFWKSRVDEHPSKKQVTLALGLDNPLLFIDAIIRSTAADFPIQIDNAIWRCILSLTEHFGISQLADVLSLIPANWAVASDSTQVLHARNIFDGIRKIVDSFTMHGRDQFADKHLQIQFIDTLQYDQCVLQQITRNKWQINLSTAASSIPLFLSRAGWLLSQQRRLISNLLEQNQAIRIILGDSASNSNTPDDGLVTLAMCAHSEVIHRLVLVEDTYLANAKKLLMTMPEPLTKDAARAIFAQRFDKLFWRGSTTGPINRNAHSLADRMLSNPRVAFCLDAKYAAPRIDASISQVAQISKDEVPRWENQLLEWGIWGERVDEKEFQKYRYYVDLDGNSAAWGTFQKYLGLCLIVKPESDWKVLYHEYLVDGVNFLSASSTKISDIEKALGQRSQEDLFEIAYSGHLMAHEYLRRITSDPSARISIGKALRNI